MMIVNTKISKHSSDLKSKYNSLPYEKILKLNKFSFDQLSSTFADIINDFNKNKLNPNSSKIIENNNNNINSDKITSIKDKEFIDTLSTKVKKKLSNMLINSNNSSNSSNSKENNNKTYSNCSTNANSSNNSNKTLIDVNINNIEEIISSFELKKIPPFNLSFYMKTVCETINFEQSTVIYAICLLYKFLIKLSNIYFDNSVKKNSKAKKLFSSTSVFKLAAIVLFISMKINEDIVLNYTDYSELVGLDIDKLWSLEREILEIIEYNAIISDEEYYKIILMLIKKE